MHAKTGLGEASSAGESRKSAADVADARAAATGQSLRPLGTVFVWPLGTVFATFGMVFVADARECRFLMKPKVKPKVVHSPSISSSRRRFADVVVATWDLLCLHHVGWLSLPLVAHKLPPVGQIL